MTTLLFPTDPDNGLSWSCSDRLDVLIKYLQIEICYLHAENYEEMAKKKLKEINTLFNNAKTAFREDQINQIVVESKQKAFNKAQLLKRNRKRAKTAPQRHEQNPRIQNMESNDQRRGRDHSRTGKLTLNILTINIQVLIICFSITYHIFCSKNLIISFLVPLLNIDRRY